MRKEIAKTNAEIASGGNILAGLWLIIAPFALGYVAFEAPLWNDVVIGIAVFILALMRVLAPLAFTRISWTNFVLGLWLIVAPFILAYDSPAPLWNDIATGIVVICLAGWSIISTRSFRPMS